MNKLILGALAFVGLSAVAGAVDSPPATPVTTQYESSINQTIDRAPAAVPVEVQTTVTDKQVEETYKRSTPSTETTGLSNDNYYINVDGNKVHSPAKSLDGGVPAGATARCRDGTYSFSQNRRGTCSHHGGVASWL